MENTRGGENNVELANGSKDLAKEFQEQVENAQKPVEKTLEAAGEVPRERETPGKGVNNEAAVENNNVL